MTSVFLGITESSFWWIFRNSYYIESLQIIDKFCIGPWAIFLNMGYIFMQVIRNVKQSFPDVPENGVLNISQILQENIYAGVSF